MAVRPSDAELLGIDLRLLELERPDNWIQQRVKLRGWSPQVEQLLAARRAQVSGQAGR